MAQTDDPTEGKSLTEIEAFLRNLKAGDEVAIRNTHGSILLFQIATVTGVNRGRLYSDQAGQSGGLSWYIKSGKHTFHPKGQARLFIPTDEVRTFLSDHPQGVWTYNIYHPQ